MTQNSTQVNTSHSMKAHQVREPLKAELCFTADWQHHERLNTSGLNWRLFHRFHRAFKECLLRRGSRGELNCSASWTWPGRIVLEHRLLPWFVRYPQQGWKDFPPKALLPSRRAEIPSNRYWQLLQGRLTTETQDSREGGEKRKINEKSGDRGKGN